MCRIDTAGGLNIRYGYALQRGGHTCSIVARCHAVPLNSTETAQRCGAQRHCVRLAL